MTKEYKKCQSCSMPIKKSEDRGTERNYEKSSMYCKYCYQEGEFTQKNISVEGMKEFEKESVLKWVYPNF